MSHLVAAPDKYRGTATAAQVAAAVGRAARHAGWTVDEIPMADGGEGTLEAMGGERRSSVVTGPVGSPVEAEWRLLADGPTAIIESAKAAGRALMPAPRGDDVLRASTVGVGELVLAAVGAGARQIVVGAGGSATTDGGWGAVCAIGSTAQLGGARLVVACDVDVPFEAAASLFGPQKGASSVQVSMLERRLRRLAIRYRHEWGVDVRALAGAGAAGGLAGGLAALGAALVPGFELVAGAVGLEQRLARADLVVTGEGRLDPTSFAGKVVGGVIEMTGAGRRVLCVAGEVAPEVDRSVLRRPRTVDVVSLVEAVGRQRAWQDTEAAVAEVVAARLAPGRVPQGPLP